MWARWRCCLQAPLVSGTQQPQSAGTRAAAAEAAAELAEIQQRQEQVINAVGVPIWYWWALAAPIVAIGAARDSGDLIVQAITIPLAVLVMVALIGAAIPELRRRVQVYSSAQAPARIAAAIIGMIVLVDGVNVGTAIGLNAVRYHPGTIGCAAGAAVLVIVGPPVNRYGRRLMLRQARQQLSGAPQAAGTP